VDVLITAKLLHTDKKYLKGIIATCAHVKPVDKWYVKIKYVDVRIMVKLLLMDKKYLKEITAICAHAKQQD